MASRTLFIAACAFGLSAATPRPLLAQARSGRLEVSAGVRMNGPFTIASADAEENAPNGGSRPLFATQTRLGRSLFVTAGVSARVSAALHAEFNAGYGSGDLTTKVTADAEPIADVSVSAPMTQLLAEAGLRMQPQRWKRRTWTPFVSAGVGYLRQMYAGRTLIESGSDAYAGGGLYYERTSAHPRRLKATGLRLDLRGYVMRGGIASGTALRAAPAVLASAFARF
ncbi:MAG: hypothetical protein U0Q11_07205 [Vicinamibacterales bacterium]